MELFNNAPIDIVNYILSYDSRFTIMRGVAVVIPFTKRYQHIIELLQNKPKPNLVKKTDSNFGYLVFFDDKYKKLFVNVFNDSRPTSYFLCHRYHMLHLYSN